MIPLKFIKFDELSSTNDYLRRKLDIEEYDVIIAKKRKNEMERKDSIYISGEGAALFSFAVEYRKEILDRMTIFSSYIVYRVLEKFLKDNEEENLKFKWPNNIYYKDKKICSIVCEKIRDYILIGIEININNTVFDSLKDEAVSLYEITGTNEDVDNIIKETVTLFEEKMRTFNKEWEKTIKLMNNISYLNGKMIKIKSNGNFEDKMYKVSRIERNGKISILGKGDMDEKEFESLEFKIITK